MVKLQSKQSIFKNFKEFCCQNESLLNRSKDHIANPNDVPCYDKSFTKMFNDFKHFINLLFCGNCAVLLLIMTSWNKCNVLDTLFKEPILKHTMYYIPILIDQMHRMEEHDEKCNYLYNSINWLSFYSGKYLRLSWLKKPREGGFGFVCHAFKWVLLLCIKQYR